MATALGISVVAVWGKGEAGGDRPSPFEGLVSAQLAGESSLLGVLGNLAALRDAETGRYVHPDGGGFDADALETELLRCHRAALRQWLSYDLRRQRADFERFVAAMAGCGGAPLSRDWLSGERFHRMLPYGIDEPERLLFRLDMQALLAAAGECAGPFEAAQASGWAASIEAMADPRVANLLQWVDLHAGNPSLTLRRLAQLFELSAAYLGSVFKRCTGRPFRDHLRGIRIRKAAARLQNPDLSIEDVSRAAGYTKATNFSRDFRKVYGVSPHRFRRRISRL
jgi:AraC-like DNA-binding protein